MKIVYLAHSRIPSRNANSIHVINICHELAKLGHDVTLLTPDWRGTEKTDDLYSFYGVEPAFRIKKLLFPAQIRGGSTMSGLHAGLLLRSLRPDMVVGRSVYGCAMAAWQGYPVVFDSHSPIWESGKLPLRLFRSMISQGAFKKLVVNSNALRDIYIKSDVFKGTGFNPLDIVVAHNGSNEYSLTDKIDLPGSVKRPKVGYFGHLYPGRGIETILEMSERLKEVDFYIAGGEEKDIALWRKKSKGSNVHFLGFITYAEVFKYRNSCDILLAPYQKVAAPDGAPGNQTPYMNPIKIVEYMGSRKPIIASDLPTIRELLNEKNAVLVDCEAIDQWVSAVNRLVADKEFANSLAFEAYAYFSRFCTWKSRAEKLIDL